MTSLNRIADLSEAVTILRDGGVLALPTDTLYALACNVCDASAVKRVYAIKGREDGKPLPFFVESLAAAEDIAVFAENARILAQRFWPGPLTLVLEKQPHFRSDALAGSGTIALRVPDHPWVRDLVHRLGQPITGTSANRSGGADPVSAAEVRSQLDGALDLILDGGPCPVGVSSTIVDCTADPPRILRLGAVTEEQIREALTAKNRADA